MGDCCINILINIDGQEYNLSISKQVDPLTGEFIRYVFQDPYNINNPELTAYIEFNEILSTWMIIDSLSGDTLFIAGTNVPDNCPASPSEEWKFESLTLDPFSFVIYEVDCVMGLNDEPTPYPEVPEEYAVDCKNSTLLKKYKASLFKDVAAISKREVFGFDCGGEWENLFMRSLIIDALSCPPYGVISPDTERCLIGKLNEKCNC